MHLRNGVHGDFVTFAVRLLHGRVVGVLVRYEECCFDVAAVWIFALAVEDLLVQLDVVVVDGVVEGDGDHHRDVFGQQVSRHAGTVFRAEAVGQHADGRIARRSAVRIVVDVCAFRETKPINRKSIIQFNSMEFCLQQHQQRRQTK